MHVCGRDNAAPVFSLIEVGRALVATTLEGEGIGSDSWGPNTLQMWSSVLKPGRERSQKHFETVNNRGG